MPHFEVPVRNRQNARRMRRALTEPELKFWNAVRAHRLMGLSFRRQMPIGGYIADFACAEHRLIIEIDGATHSLDKQIERDYHRDAALIALGWRVIRLTNDEVLNRMDDVCTHILKVIGIERFEEV
ncbi:endonuclease domain-containing protein [Rhizobium rhizoryzae]|uniref:Very-short-patch-repair endonuclease n=1 Tax=Rhizobium rhizoryzae TaxID=451876 RepID=A0A7W6LBY2_9HYPH|nr:endonuclease domain-containing protein [Rhizobium rhizoryzae]MBB4141574.1 very-short-patch-repair endonuclease [Rhizobium rhizoryzae]